MYPERHALDFQTFRSCAGSDGESNMDQPPHTEYNRIDVDVFLFDFRTSRSERKTKQAALSHSLFFFVCAVLFSVGQSNGSPSISISSVSTCSMGRRMVRDAPVSRSVSERLMTAISLPRNASDSPAAG